MEFKEFLEKYDNAVQVVSRSSFSGTLDTYWIVPELDENEMKENRVWYLIKSEKLGVG